MRFDDDVVAMSQAAGALKYGGVTVASREAMTSAGMCRPGDVLGIVRGDILEIGESIEAVADATLDRLLRAGAELVTVVVGADAVRKDVEAVTRNVERQNPGIEVVVYEGGQPFWPMIFGVE
jgi:dihydroxyacetone kinase-like predicted kinase